MSEPRFPPITRHIIEELPQRFGMWLTPFIMRLTTLFRSMSPAEGWKTLDGNIEGCQTGTFPPTLDPIQGTSWGAAAWRFDAGVQTDCWLGFTIPNDIAFFIPNEEGGQDPSTIYPRLLWASKGTNTGTMTVMIGYLYVRPGDTTGTPTTTNYNITPSGVAGEVQMAEFNPIQSEDIEPGGKIFFRLSRRGDQGSDTLTDNVHFLSFDLVYYSDGLNTYERMPNATGSRFTKRPSFAP